MPALTRYFAHHAALAAERPLHDWAVYRWADELATIIWLFNRTADPRLLDLARTLKAQGTDWRAHFDRFAFTDKTSNKLLGFGGARAAAGHGDARPRRQRRDGAQDLRALVAGLG